MSFSFDPRTQGWVEEQGMDDFTTLVGPLWSRLDSGAKRYAFLAEQKHLNRYGGVHGGDVALASGQGVEHESLAQRTFHFEAAFQYLNEAMPARTTAEWIAAFTAVDLPNGPVNELGDLFDSTYLHETSFFNEYDHPSEGRLVATNPAVSFSRTPSGMRRPPTRLGQHTREVMNGVGFLEPEISVIEAHQSVQLAQRDAETTQGGF